MQNNVKKFETVRDSIAILYFMLSGMFFGSIGLNNMFDYPVIATVCIIVAVGCFIGGILATLLMKMREQERLPKTKLETGIEYWSDSKINFTSSRNITDNVTIYDLKKELSDDFKVGVDSE